MKRSLTTGVVVGSFIAVATGPLVAQRSGTPSQSQQLNNINSSLPYAKSQPPAKTDSASSRQAQALAAAAKEPVGYSDDNTKFEIRVPRDWTSMFVGSGPPGNVFAFHIPMDPDALKAMTAKKPSTPENPIKIHPDILSIDANAVLDAKANLDAQVVGVKDSISHEESNAVFKPVEKVKVAGLDAQALTVTIEGKAKDEPKRIERHVLFVRDGKLFDISLRSHANTFGKALAQFQTSLRSAKFNAPAKKADELVKVYDNKEQNFRFSAPVALTSGVPCHDLACNGSFFAVVFPFSRDFFRHDDSKGPATIHSEAITFASTPAKSPAQTLDAAVEDLKTEVKAANPTAEFKPIEKTKLGDAEAVVLTATTDGEKNDREPQRVQRRLVTLRNGKVFQVIHFSHVDAAEKQKPAFDSLVSSFEFTTPATVAAEAVAVPAAPATAAPAAAKPAGDGLD